MAFRFAFLGFLLLVLSNCQDKKTTSEESSDNSKTTVKETPSKKITERITNKNVIEKLTEYGKHNQENKVLLETDFGNIEIELYTETPLHRANFIQIVKRGFLSTTLFYRVAKDFVIQGGNSDGWEMSRKKRQIGDYQIPAEFNSKLKHDYGQVAMARLWGEANPEKKSSPWEFYIIVDKKGAHHLDGEHTIIGRVTKGMEIAEKISLVDVDKSEWPKKDISIKASIIK